MKKMYKDFGDWEVLMFLIYKKFFIERLAVMTALEDGEVQNLKLKDLKCS